MNLYIIVDKVFGEMFLVHSPSELSALNAVKEVSMGNNSKLITETIISNVAREDIEVIIKPEEKDNDTNILRVINCIDDEFVGI